jgi:hypothetical protein
MVLLTFRSRFIGRCWVSVRGRVMFRARARLRFWIEVLV